MSLLAELEELQRCLEGTADSDSEEAAVENKKDNIGIPVVVSSFDSASLGTVLEGELSPVETGAVAESDSSVEKVFTGDSPSVKNVSIDLEFKANEQGLAQADGSAREGARSVKQTPTREAPKDNEISVEKSSPSSNVEDKVKLLTEGTAALEEEEWVAAEKQSEIEVTPQAELLVNKKSPTENELKTAMQEKKTLESVTNVSEVQEKKIAESVTNSSEVQKKKDEELMDVQEKKNVEPMPESDTKSSDVQEKKVPEGIGVQEKKIAEAMPESVTNRLEVQDKIVSEPKAENVTNRFNVEEKKVDEPMPKSVTDQLGVQENKVAEPVPETVTVTPAQEKKFEESMIETVTNRLDVQDEKVVGSIPKSVTNQLDVQEKKVVAESAANRSDVQDKKVAELVPESVTNRLSPKKLQNNDQKQSPAILKASVLPTKNAEGGLKTSGTSASGVSVATLQNQLKSPVLNIDKIEEVKILNGKPVIRVKSISTEYNVKNRVLLQGSPSQHDSAPNKKKQIPVQDKSPVAKKRKVSFDVGSEGVRVHKDANHEKHQVQACHSTPTVNRRHSAEMLSTATLGAKRLQSKTNEIKKKVPENTISQEVKDSNLTSKFQSKKYSSTTFLQMSSGKALARKKRASSEPTSPVVGKRRKLSTSEVSSSSEPPPDLNVANTQRTFSHDSDHDTEVMNKRVDPRLDGVAKKEFLEAKVVLKKLNIPIPDCLQVEPGKPAKTKSQSLQQTLEKVSKVLQETLVESVKVKRKIETPLKLKDSIMEPLKRKQIFKKPQTNINRTLQQKMPKSKQPEPVKKPTHQKIAKKATQQNIIRKQVPQQKVKVRSVSKPVRQQKIVPKQTKKQKVTLKPKPLQTKKMPTIALKLKAKSATKIVSSKVKKSLSTVQNQKITRSITANSTRKYQEVLKSVRNIKKAEKPPKKNNEKSAKKLVLKKLEKRPGPSGSGHDKKPVPKKSTQAPVHATKSFLRESPRNRSVVGKKSVAAASAVVKEVKKKAPVMLTPPKKIVTVNRRRGKILRPSSEEDNHAENVENVPDDEWIVEVLLDENELMSPGNAHSDFVDIGKVTSSDDRPKGSHVSNSETIECDSSTDTNKSSKKAVGEMRTPAKVTEKAVKQVSSSVTDGKTSEEHMEMSVEKKMVEMRKAIGDLERIADRSMLRLKAEERHVVYLSKKLQQYNNDKHYKMLRKVMQDAAPGPTQNTDAVFILDLLLSYCPQEEEAVTS